MQSCEFRLYVQTTLTTTLQAYGYMEEETEAERLEREEAERQMQPDKAYKDPSQMSRKQRKKALEGVGALNVRSRCSKRRLTRLANRLACASQLEQASRARAGAATTRGFLQYVARRLLRILSLMTPSRRSSAGEEGEGRRGPTEAEVSPARPLLQSQSLTCRPHREDAAKKLEEKRKRAQKVERKG